MATLKLVANINLGDETTTSENLIFRIYNGDVVFYTTGSATDDSNVTLVGTTVTILNVEREDQTSYAFTIASVDEAHNENVKSNIINITTGPGNEFYASGMYASGMYA